MARLKPMKADECDWIKEPKEKAKVGPNKTLHRTAYGSARKLARPSAVLRCARRSGRLNPNVMRVDEAAEIN